MRTPINGTRISRSAIREIFHTRKCAPQKFPRRLGVIPTTSEIMLIRVKPAPESACSVGRGRQKQVYIFRILKIGLGKESEVFVRSHPEIVRSAKGGHFAFHTKKSFLRLSR